MSDSVDQLPTRLSEDLDRRLDEFDTAWNDGRQPDLRRFVPSALRTNKIPKRPQWRRYVAELLTIDLEYRIRQPASEASPQVEDYFERIPWLERDELVLLEIIPAEYMARQAHGDRPGVGEYYVRFPQLSDALTESLEVADTNLVLEDSTGTVHDGSEATESLSPLDATVNSAVSDRTQFEASSEPVVPTGATREFGNYELQKEIARGGMGIVYKASQRSLKRTVAVKVILAGRFAQAEDIHRFHAEAEAAARLNHPNIVPIYEVGQIEEHYFFSMAYIDGRSLSAEVGEQPLDAKRAARIMRDVADAIGYAHQNDIIHRDLKPSNILLEEEDTPRITDFGLARQSNVESGVTVTGQVIGTPTYMPPEQALGKIDQIDVRSDVYSLGATLYCLLTGRGPFQAATVVQTLAQVVREDPVPPRRLNTDIPRDLENICLKCLTKSPDHRYQTAAELRDDFDRFLNGRPTVARPLSSTERTLRFCRRNPGISALIATSVSLLAALIGVMGWAYFETLNAYNRSEFDRVEIERQKLEVDGARKKAEAALQVAELNIYLNSLERTQQLWNEGQVTLARDLLDKLPKMLALWDELHGWEYDHIDRVLHQQQQAAIQAHDQPALAACWSPDGTLFATAGQDNVIKVWDHETGRLHSPPLTGHQDWVWDIQFVNQGRQLLSVSRDGDVRLWDADKGVLEDVLYQGAETIELAAISRDGSRWAQADGSGNISVWDVASQSKLAEWSKESATTALALSQSGSQVAYCQVFRDDAGENVEVLFRQVENDGHVVVATSADAAPMALAFSSDGNRVAGGGRGDQLRVWDTTDGTRLARWTAHRGSIYGIAFGADPDQLLTCSADQTIRLWSISTESELDVFRGHSGPVFDADIRPCGIEIVSVGDDGTVRLWQPGRDQFELTSLSPRQVVHLDAVGTGLEYLTGDGLRTVDPSHSRDVHIVSLNGSDLDLGTPLTAVIPLQLGHDSYAVAAENQVAICDGEGRLIHKLPEFASDVHHLSASAEGTFLAATDRDGMLRMFETGSATQLWEFDFGIRVAAIVFCQEGSGLFAIDFDGQAVVFDAKSGESLRQSQLIDDVTAIAVSQTEPVLALGRVGGQIGLYDLKDLSLTTTLDGHQGEVAALAFRADGSRLASGGGDDFVRIWAPQVRTWAPEQTALLLTLEGHKDAIRHVFWTRQDDELLSVDRSGTAIRWRTRSSE